MKKLPLWTRGLTLTELMVSVAILSIFMGMVAWMVKGFTLHRTSSEKRLKLLEKLQRVMVFIENDLLSARRHTLGNVLCTVGAWPSSCDPGFDFSDTSLTNDSSDHQHWYTPFVSLAPSLNGTVPYTQAYIDRSPQNRLFGTGTLHINSNRVGRCIVRSPDFSLVPQRTYVLAGWVKGQSFPSANATLSSSLALQTRSGGNGDPSNDITHTLSQGTATWTYVSTSYTPSSPGPYNLYLRTNIDVDPSSNFLSGFFDNITVTASTQIADLSFVAAQNYSGSSAIDFNEFNTLGMVFYQTDFDSSPLPGDTRGMRYTFSRFLMASQPIVFPPDKPDISRVVIGALAPLSPLPNISQLSVSWVGDTTRGANRPIEVTVTVRDREDASKTLSLSRTLYPPTD